MSDEEVLAQVFMLGWSSQDAEGPIMDWIAKRGLGGIKIFGWNGVDIERMARAIGEMQGTALKRGAGIPLLTATDQEGGWVRHIKGPSSQTPGSLSIGASDLPSDAWYSANYIAMELRAMGVNMNFAPTVDVYTNPEAHVIGPRAFSSDAYQTAVLSTAYFHGQDTARVISTAKHFPGHGNALGDSHGVLPVLEEKLDTLWDRELLPYRMLIPEQVPAILTGHLSFPRLTGNDRPASLSPEIIKDLLRNKLDYQGLVITDDIYMGGAANYGASRGWAMSRIIFEALDAGNDMVMLSLTPAFNDAIWTYSLGEYKKNGAFKDQIQDSVLRILKLKLAYLQGPDRVPLKPDPKDLAQTVPAKGSANFFRDQAQRAVTVIKQGRLPFKPESGKTVLLMGQDPDFISLGKELFPSAQTFRWSYEPFYWANSTDIASAVAVASKADYIVFCLANPNSLEILQALEAQASKILVMSSLTPVYLKKTPWVQSSLAIYGWDRASFEAGFSVLSGKVPALGTLPVDVD